MEIIFSKNNDKPAINPPAQHLKFLKWSLISMAILFIFFSILGIIIYIWRKKKLEEKKGFLKNNRNESQKSYRLDDEEKSPRNVEIESNQIFVIGNEKIEIEMKNQEI